MEPRTQEDKVQEGLQYKYLLLETINLLEEVKDDFHYLKALRIKIHIEYLIWLLNSNAWKCYDKIHDHYKNSFFMAFRIGNGDKDYVQAFTKFAAIMQIELNTFGVVRWAEKLKIPVHVVESLIKDQRKRDVVKYFCVDWDYPVPDKDFERLGSYTPDEQFDYQVHGMKNYGQ